jgi:hypothetical protein
MNKQIYAAIKERQLIWFYYEELQRIVRPYAYGIHKDTGNEVLRAYQVGGYSSSGNIPGWRLYIGRFQILRLLMKYLKIQHQDTEKMILQCHTYFARYRQ